MLIGAGYVVMAIPRRANVLPPLVRAPVSPGAFADQLPLELGRLRGSQVRGGGVDVDMRRKTIRFTGPVMGTLVTDTGEED